MYIHQGLDPQLKLIQRQKYPYTFFSSDLWHSVFISLKLLLNRENMHKSNFFFHITEIHIETAFIKCLHAKTMWVNFFQIFLVTLAISEQLVLKYKVLHNWGSTEKIINCLINAVLVFFVHIVYTSGSCSKWSPEDHYYHGCWPHPQNTYNTPAARSIWIWSKPNLQVPHHSRYINMFCKINITQLSEY